MFTNGKYFNDKNTTILKDDGTAYPTGKKSLPKRILGNAQNNEDMLSSNMSEYMVAASEEDYRRAQELGEQNILPPPQISRPLYEDQQTLGIKTESSSAQAYEPWLIENDIRDQIQTFMAESERKAAELEQYRLSLEDSIFKAEHAINKVKEQRADIASGEIWLHNSQRKSEVLNFLLEKDQEAREQLGHAQKKLFEVYTDNLVGSAKATANEIMENLPSDKVTGFLNQLKQQGAKKAVSGNLHSTLSTVLSREKGEDIPMHSIGANKGPFRPWMVSGEDVAEEVNLKVSDIYFQDGVYKVDIAGNILRYDGTPFPQSATLSLGSKFPTNLSVDVFHPNEMEVQSRLAMEEFLNPEYGMFVLEEVGLSSGNPYLATAGVAAAFINNYASDKLQKITDKMYPHAGAFNKDSVVISFKAHNSDSTALPWEAAEQQIAILY